jgi:hypothetical protein
LGGCVGVYFDGSGFCKVVSAFISLLGAMFGINDPLLEVKCWCRSLDRAV